MWSLNVCTLTHVINPCCQEWHTATTLWNVLPQVVCSNIFLPEGVNVENHTSSSFNNRWRHVMYVQIQSKVKLLKNDIRLLSCSEYCLNAGKVALATTHQKEVSVHSWSVPGCQFENVALLYKLIGGIHNVLFLPQHLINLQQFLQIVLWGMAWSMSADSNTLTQSLLKW